MEMGLNKIKQVKFFHGNLSDMQVEINNWLTTHHSLESLHYQQSSTNGQITYSVMIVYWV